MYLYSLGFIRYHFHKICKYIGLAIVFASILLAGGCIQKVKNRTYQNGIPNGDFEKWDSSGYEIPRYALESSNPQSFVTTPEVYNCLKVTDAYHGRYALKVITLKGASDNCAGYFSNCHLYGRAPTWLGGVSYDQKPTGIRGYYKAAIPPGDSGLIWINFNKGRKSIGCYALKFYGTHDVYTRFAFTFDPPLKSVPDTMMFTAVSSDLTDSLAVSVPGSWLQLDSICFTGVKKQPDMFDGDFENWQYQTLLNPHYWNFQSGHGEGISYTADAHTGLYALQLTTFLGDNNGIPMANPEKVENGSWTNSKNYHEGFAFSNQLDTLALHYKYSAALPSDSATIGLSFKKNNKVMQYLQLRLGATSQYHLAQLPVSLNFVPDTVILQIESSQWANDAIIHVGSVLKIDDLHFKSQSAP